MLDKKEFKAIAKEFAEKDLVREKSIQTSRELIKQSKKVINAVHVGDFASAKREAKVLSALKKKLEAVRYASQHENDHRTTAFQEYVEALAYLSFAEKRRVPSRKQLRVDTENYVTGLCDMTGELIRKSLNEIMEGRYDFAVDSKKLIDELHRNLSEMYLAGEFRKKADMVRWNLGKIEDILFTARMRGCSQIPE